MDFGADHFRGVRRFGVGIGINPSYFHPVYLTDGADLVAPHMRAAALSPATPASRRSAGR